MATLNCPFLSLAQVQLWIMRRDAGAVINLSPHSDLANTRARFIAWHSRFLMDGFEATGGDLSPAKKEKAARMASDLAKAAEVDLIDKLQRAKLVLYGRSKGATDYAQVSPSVATTLVAGSGDVARSPEAQPAGWAELRCGADEVLAIWAPLPPESEEALSCAVRRRIRLWREKHNECFAERQRRQRRWFSLAEIADWCAREPGSIKPDEERRALAYAELGKALRDGEFEQGGRSRVLYLNPETSWARMTRARFTEIVDAFGSDHDLLVSAYLARCWLPHDLAQRWFKMKNLRPHPYWFQPPTEDTSTSQQEGLAVAIAANAAANKDNAHLKSAGPTVDPYRTGGQGRPTMKHLIIAEFKRRLEAGEVLPSLAAEARALDEWAQRTHLSPPAPRVSVRTIENIIRDKHRKHKIPNPTKTPTK